MIPKTLKKGPAYPIPVTHAVIHTCRDCIVMAMRCATDDGDATIECFDLASGKRRWKVVVGHPTFEMPVSWLLATGDVVWTTEEVATATGNPHNVKKHKALVARDIHTGETLWKKRESSGAAIIAGGKLILNGHNSMKCYTSA